MSAAHDLADRFHQAWLATHPFAASSYGIPGFDHLVPDDSEEGGAAWRSTVASVLADARALEKVPVGVEDGAGADDAITLGCLIEAAGQELADLDSAPVDHTVTAMPFSGPAVLLAVAARTVLADPTAAGDHLERLRRSAGWIDQLTARLGDGAAKGRLPVAPLVEEAIRWADGVLADPVPVALATAEPPQGWAGAATWPAERNAVVVDVVVPALRRWRDGIAELLPRARPGEEAGLCHLPDGAADYARAIRTHTTLPLTADQLHRTGRDEIARLEARAVALGAELGLADLEAVFDALRASAGSVPPGESIEAATAAVRRAEARAPEVFPQPLPPPCAVTAMPTVVGASGMAPHYSPPRLDGSRAGTYWFNVDRPTAGTGWDLEAVAFHEAVPGHHLQLSRIQLLTDLPAFQRQRSITVFSEGWGLYAEELADEMGLYGGVEERLGALTTALMRAARLVVDTGLHALGWSRHEALDFFTAHVPLPAGFLATEIDRYIIMPGQALAYLTGKREILRLRDQARRALGEQFSLPDFHAAVLDHGSLPMPVLQRSIDGWLAAGGAAHPATA